MVKTDTKDTKKDQPTSKYSGKKDGSWRALVGPKREAEWVEWWAGLDKYKSTPDADIKGDSRIGAVVGIDEACHIWREGEGGMTQRKLYKVLRERYPVVDTTPAKGEPTKEDA